MANMLVMFGFSWMVMAAIIGLLLAKRHEVAVGSLEKIAATGNLAEYHRVYDAYKWNKLVHVHSFLFSVVAVCVGLAMAKMGYSESAANGLAIALMLAPPVWTVGAVRMSKPLMVIADMTLLFSLIAAAVGMAMVL